MQNVHLSLVHQNISKMKRYSVYIDFYSIEIKGSAKNKAEAKRKAKAQLKRKIASLVNHIYAEEI